MIELQGVRKSFGDNEVLKGVDLKVEPGSVHGYLGPNGAGKTTTIKIMLGILEPDAGRAIIAGVDPAVDPVGARSQVGYVPEVLSIYEHLTPFEFLHVVGEIHGMKRAKVRDRAMDFMNLLQLSTVVHQRMSAFSRGMKQKVMVAAALIHDPKVIMLDEPLSGMDVNSILVFRDLIRRLAEEGARVLCLDLPSDAAAAQTLAAAIGGVPVLADLMADDAGELVAAAAMKEADGLDVVVHNAGVIADKTLGGMSESAWDLVLGVNLLAPLRVTQALRKADALRPGGRIIHLSSVAGIAGNAGQSNYATAKAGLRGWSAALAAELAPMGVTVNAVAPGFIETRMTATIPFAIREGGRRLAALGQGGQPSDVAELITFLATAGSCGLTGRTLRICGGALIGA